MSRTILSAWLKLISVAITTILLMSTPDSVEGGATPAFVVAAEVVPTQTDVKLHVRITYQGEGAIEVYALFTSSVRVTAPGTWDPIPAPTREVITGVGPVVTETLHKGEFVEGDYPLRALFRSIKEGPNEWEIEATILPVKTRSPVALRQKVSVNLSTQEAALVNNPPAVANPK